MTTPRLFFALVLTGTTAVIACRQEEPVGDPKTPANSPLPNLPKREDDPKSTPTPKLPFLGDAG